MKSFILSSYFDCPACWTKRVHRRPVPLRNIDVAWFLLLGMKQNWDRLYPATLFPFSSSLRPPTVSLPGSITLGSHNISFSDSARNLGVILDSNLSMKKHVINICQTAYFELKRISSIRGFLTQDAAKTLNCYLLYPLTA